MRLDLTVSTPNGESFEHKDTRVPNEPRHDLRKKTNSKEQQNSMLLLIQIFLKLSIHEKNEEDLSKKRKERDFGSLLFQLNSNLMLTWSYEVKPLFPRTHRIPLFDQVKHPCS